MVVCVSEGMLLGVLSGDQERQEQAEHMDEQLGAASVDQVMPTRSMVSSDIREVSAVPVCRVFSSEDSGHAPPRWIATGRYKTICAYRYSSPPRSRGKKRMMKFYIR